MPNQIPSPLVTVVCTVFNHGKYLKSCLDGFVMQKTDFPFIVLVHDDCSTDDSVRIIKEYADKYPNIIIPIIETENQYSKHDGSLMRAIDVHIKSKYVAYCEGDDFWTSPQKLQVQVDYMERHPDCALCFHDVDILYKGKPASGKKLYAHLHEGQFTGDEIIRRWTVPTCSAMMRSAHYLSRPYDRNFAVGDNVMWLNSLQYGYAYCIFKKMARILGALYFINNINEDDLVRRCRRALWGNTALFLLFFLAFVIRTLVADGYAVRPETGEVFMEPYKYLTNFLQMPVVLLVFLVGVVAVLWGIIRTLWKPTFDKGIWFAGAGTVLTVLALLLVTGYNNTAYYPSTHDLQSSLTLANSCSSRFTLKVMAYVSILVPFVLAYIFYAWRSIDNRKIDAKEMEEGGHAY